jgi:hypothetical protein
MNRLSSTPLPQVTPVASRRGQGPPIKFDTEQGLRSTSDRTRAAWSRAELRGPVNTIVKACYRTSAVYSCEDIQCPLRERCKGSVSPWRF